jgi:hypothetical protein
MSRRGEFLELSPARAYLPDENFLVLILGTVALDGGFVKPSHSLVPGFS